jgi:hypothetical protein
MHVLVAVVGGVDAPAPEKALHLVEGDDGAVGSVAIGGVGPPGSCLGGAVVDPVDDLARTGKCQGGVDCGVVGVDSSGIAVHSYIVGGVCGSRVASAGMVVQLRVPNRITALLLDLEATGPQLKEEVVVGVAANGGVEAERVEVKW